MSKIAEIKRLRPAADVIMVTGHKEGAILVEAVRRGASDYLVKPFAIAEVEAIIEKLAPYQDLRQRERTLLFEINERDGEPLILGYSPRLLNQLEQAYRLKGQNTNVLIEGETGTGKELLARFIHRLEQDASRPFVAINCAAIPENLLESELFGHEKGAFTGAVERKIGKFELADGGDLFLDEISSLRMDLQSKILRAIQEQEIMRIGSTAPVKVRFRVISASNENLETWVEQGRFRRDLFHRLRVITLTLPPLRERGEDVEILAKAFLKRHTNGKHWAFSKEAMMALQEYAWPGNVRELENLVQSLSVLAPGPVITVSDLPGWIFGRANDIGWANSDGSTQNDIAVQPPPSGSSDFLSLKEYITRAERAHIRKALEQTEGDKSKAAALLQISRSRLYERLRGWKMMIGGIGNETEINDHAGCKTF